MKNVRINLWVCKKTKQFLTVVDVAYHVYFTCVYMHSSKLDMNINLFLAFKKLLREKNRRVSQLQVVNVKTTILVLVSYNVHTKPCDQILNKRVDLKIFLCVCVCLIVFFANNWGFWDKAKPSKYVVVILHFLYNCPFYIIVLHSMVHFPLSTKDPFWYLTSYQEYEY